MVKRVSLASKLDTAAADTLRDEIVAAEGQDLIFDAAAVEQLGGLCLEVILSTAALWKTSGHTVTLDNPSSHMVDDLGRFGLTPDTLMETAG